MAVQYKPTLDEFNEDVSSVIQRFEDTVLSVANLVPDPFFDAFTRPMINKNFEEKTCGDGPSLEGEFSTKNAIRSEKWGIGRKDGSVLKHHRLF